MKPIVMPSEPATMRYVFSTQPWWMNAILWIGRLALAGAILVMVVPLGLTLWGISTGAPPSEKPAWASGYNPVWIAMWFMQGMIWCFLAVTLYRGLKGLPVVYKDQFVAPFSFDAAAIWSLLPLGLFLLPLQLAYADLLILPEWTKTIYGAAGWLVKYFGWLI